MIPSTLLLSPYDQIQRELRRREKEAQELAKLERMVNRFVKHMDRKKS